MNPTRKVLWLVSALLGLALLVPMAAAAPPPPLSSLTFLPGDEANGLAAFD